MEILMATYPEAMQYIKSNYEYKESNNLVTLEFKFADGRAQTVYIPTGLDQGYLAVSSPFAMNISADLALQAANDGMFGVRKVGDLFALWHVIPLADLDASEIDFGIKAVAIAADTLEEKFGSDQF
jgi:hypothetical protein